jgi:1,2-diacylglycerol 3-beta-glucosyltransferase
VILDALLLAMSLPVLAVTTYLFVLTVLSRRAQPRAHGEPSWRFDIVVPAHDEEAGVATTVSNLLALDYPEPMRRVLVVADNCSDATAARARGAGATVIERNDRTRIGKGHALAAAFKRCQADGLADAVVVIDADTVASPDLLRALAAELDAGASAVQVHYAVRNPNASWRTRLMAIAFCLFHKVRSLGRERLGVSAGLRGNGMCFTVELLGKVPHEAYSEVEDVEYGIRLGLAGFRVRYCDDAAVYGEMVSGERASRSQRRRWEGGRHLVRRAWAPALLREVVRRRDPVLLDLLIDVVTPPISAVAFWSGCGLLLSATASVWAGHTLYAVYAWLISAAFLAAYVFRGVWLAGLGIGGVTALLCAPLYLVWKVALPFLRGSGRRGWVRTSREPQHASKPTAIARQINAVVAPTLNRRPPDVSTAP